MEHSGSWFHNRNHHHDHHENDEHLVLIDLGNTLFDGGVRVPSDPRDYRDKTATVMQRDRCRNPRD